MHRGFVASTAILTGAFIALAGGSVSAAETLSGTYAEVITSSQELALANGDALTMAVTKGSATFGDPSNPGILSGDCIVYILVKAGVYGDSGHCNWRESDKGSYVINFKTGPEGTGTFDIVGGDGKWKGASGSGSYAGTWGEDDRFGGTFEAKFD